MSEKVVLPKDIVDAIENLKTKGWDASGILIQVAQSVYNEKDFATLHLYVWEEYSEINEKFLLLTKALLNGYTVAKSPGQKVREFYEAFAESDDSLDQGVSYGITRTLDMLGIKIAGINA
jgi:hypothetical protein